MGDRDDLRKFITELGVVRGQAVLSSGREAGWCVNLRHVARPHVAAPQVGREIPGPIAERDFDVVGSLTHGADPMTGMLSNAATAVIRRLDVPVVRQSGSSHRERRQAQWWDVFGRRAPPRGSTSTPEGSVLRAVEALQEAEVEVVGVEVLVDRGVGNAVRAAGLSSRTTDTLTDLGLTA